MAPLKASLFFKTLYWYASFFRLYGFRLYPKTQLSLILGPGRSGTTWVLKILGMSVDKSRVLNEPLISFLPKIISSKKYDLTATPFGKTLVDYKYYLTYKALSCAHYIINPKHKHTIVKNTKGFQYCFVKEVHALLSTDYLSRKLNSPILLLIRNPLHTVDSHMCLHGEGSPGGRNEIKNIQSNKFLNKYFKNDKDKIKKLFAEFSNNPKSMEREIKERVLTTAIINKMLISVNKVYANTILIRYEQLLDDPIIGFKCIFKFFNLNFGEPQIATINNTQNETKDSSDPYSVYRDPKKQMSKKLKYLTPKLVDDINQTMEELSFWEEVCTYTVK